MWGSTSSPSLIKVGAGRPLAKGQKRPISIGTKSFPTPVCGGFTEVLAPTRKLVAGENYWPFYPPSQEGMGVGQHLQPQFN